MESSRRKAETAGIIGSSTHSVSMIEGVLASNGYEVWRSERRNAKRELKKRKEMCRVIVFSVEDEEEYRKERKKRHALIGDIRVLEPRLEVICVVSASLCEGVCGMRCTKVTCKEKSFSMVRNEIEQVLRGVELSCW